ncbi:Bacterial regulatory proteins, tetR family [Propionibacterium australiense]|uniref:DNA-binding HTH domain, TetR-type n=1 Tax=Propionibacterium australiense TaxID=119981 RepID=A0A383S5C5_9ACTN|nr:DNA-binding HTH domain, TetR-type [Propionibacterium australiense]VEH92446.1 Bacterial regulatory proteins, tetR family [Propionibacterium australiense]
MKFSAGDILDAAARVVLAHSGSPTVAEIAREVGAPVGSVYYRFASRDELLVSLWLLSVRDFQRGFMAACCREPAEDAVVAAARHIPVYCREHPAEARAMTLYRQTELVRTAPESLRDEVATVNDQVNALSLELTRRRYGVADERRTTLIATATRQCPYGLVRPHLGGPIPDWIDDATAACARAITALGD